MIGYALKLTVEPWAMIQDDVEALREVGFSDAEILVIAQVTSFFAFANRLSDGLGIEVEPVWPPR